MDFKFNYKMSTWKIDRIVLGYFFKNVPEFKLFLQKIVIKYSFL